MPLFSICLWINHVPKDNMWEGDAVAEVIHIGLQLQWTELVLMQNLKFTTDPAGRYPTENTDSCSLAGPEPSVEVSG